MVVGGGGDDDAVGIFSLVGVISLIAVVIDVVAAVITWLLMFLTTFPTTTKVKIPNSTFHVLRNPFGQPRSKIPYL